MKKYEKHIAAFAKNDEACKRLQKIPGAGPIIATAIAAHAGDATQCKNGSAFAASLGLTPKEHSSGGKQKLLGLTKRGNGTIRMLPIQGARIVARYVLARGQENTASQKWLQGVAARRGKHVAAAALANKMAGMESAGRKRRVPASSIGR